MNRIADILRHQARDGNVWDHSNDTVIVTRPLLTKAADEIEKLREALEEQWQSNHAEHCGHADCVSMGGTRMCHWERPAALNVASEQLSEPPK